jgi:hypothetical protein
MFGGQGGVRRMDRRKTGGWPGVHVLAASHRTDRSAAAFARIKSVIVTGMMNGVRFIEYGTEVVRAKLRGERLPLPLTAATDTS